MYVLVELLVAVSLFSAFWILYLSMYNQSMDVCYSTVEDGITVCCTISVCSLIIVAFVLLFTTALKQFKTHFVSALIIGIMLLALLLCSYCIIWKKLNMGKMKKIILYKKQLDEVESRIKITKRAIKKLKNDKEIEETQKKETLALLKESKKSLKSTYVELKLAIHMIQVGDTICGLNDTWSKEELQHQLDIMESRKRLTASLEDNYKD